VPEILVQDLLKWLDARGFSDQQEVEAKKESLTFALPQNLRSEMKAAGK
jgi:4-hydroxy-3-methylbut-2-enyl diphosphate reductase